MLGRASKVFHKKEAAVKTYTSLEAFQKADYYGKLKSLSQLTHQLRWVKSAAEVRLMRESASIACQVYFLASVVSNYSTTPTILNNFSSSCLF